MASVSEKGSAYGDTVNSTNSGIERAAAAAPVRPCAVVPVASTRSVLLAQLRSASRIVKRSWQSCDEIVKGAKSVF